jgi:hypothetical protein
MALTLPALPPYAAESLPRVLLLHTGALFSFEVSVALPLPFGAQFLFLLASLPVGLKWAIKYGSATIRAAGLHEQACRLHQAARWLSVRHRAAFIDRTPRSAGGAALCPPHAEEVVAMTALAVVGFIAPIVASWLTEMHYRCNFARVRGPRALQLGPAALRWSPLQRARTAGIALLVSSVLALSLIDIVTESTF